MIKTAHYLDRLMTISICIVFTTIVIKALVL